MMLATVLLAALPAPGCGPVGRAVTCELAPASLPGVAPPTTKPGTRPRAQPVERQRDRAAPRRKPSPDDGAIARHVRSLTSIDDCTGARTYLISIGKTAAARATFERCVTGATISDAVLREPAKRVGTTIE